MIAPQKNDEKCFSFHLKSSFCSQVIQIFVLNFWSCRKNGFIRNIRLISKFMTSYLVNKDLQYTYCSISHKLKTTTTKFGQLTRDIFFFKNYAENEIGGLVPDRFLFLKKALLKVKATDLQLGFIIFR